MCSVLFCTPHPFAQYNFLKSQLTGKRHPLQASPYADLLSSSHWNQLERHFTREFCSLLGMSQDPPLQLSVDVGAAAIPTMIKLKTVMDQRRKQRPKMEMWSADNELPVSSKTSIYNYVI
jgi:hypothetical protein